MRLGLALRAFWKALFEPKVAERVALALDGPGSLGAGSAAPEVAAEQKPVVAAKPKSAQSEAIALLAALQRDARFVDLIQEDLDRFSDEQIGAAARPCLKACRQTLDRLVAIKPLVDAADGDVIAVDETASAARVRWVGESSGASQAKLVRKGWEATKVQLPAWSGSDDDAKVISPNQVEAV
ncbi:DUF2760 domain-containing protein [Rhodopirellula sp. JC740]|uniref:DUF2760 domain-containing protein n=1 Tax=Rhodopirellula halodulae TaxID=2894198 RepID=A0ABS8NL37_9BACT|nr:DUF2760 domain-containing protein [Rhodopirellula sp. JC740]MCC9644226.1 DUF2760 domain-containing protein [Rhodopirellula sp. JC740]